MNEALIKELKKYYYSNAYDRPGNDEIETAYGKVALCLESLDNNLRSKIEYAVTGLEIERELRGFLRGYEYCILMMGLQGH